MLRYPLMWMLCLLLASTFVKCEYDEDVDDSSADGRPLSLNISGCAVVYAEHHFNGTNATIQEGTIWTFNDAGFSGDAIGSVIVGAGCMLHMFERSELRGSSKDYAAGAHGNMPTDHSRSLAIFTELSSARCYCGKKPPAANHGSYEFVERENSDCQQSILNGSCAAVFDQPGCWGRKLPMENNFNRLFFGWGWEYNDAIKSIVVGERCRLSLCSHMYRRGHCTDYSNETVADIGYVDASSGACECFDDDSDVQNESSQCPEPSQSNLGDNCAILFTNFNCSGRNMTFPHGLSSRSLHIHNFNDVTKSAIVAGGCELTLCNAHGFYTPGEMCQTLSNVSVSNIGHGIWHTDRASSAKCRCHSRTSSCPAPNHDLQDVIHTYRT